MEASSSIQYADIPEWLSSNKNPSLNPTERLAYMLITTHIQHIMTKEGKSLAGKCLCGTEMKTGEPYTHYLLGHPGILGRSNLFTKNPIDLTTTRLVTHDCELLPLKFWAWIICRTGDPWVRAVVAKNKHKLFYGIPPELICVISAHLPSITIMQAQVPLTELGLQTPIVTHCVPPKYINNDLLYALDRLYIGRAVGLLSYNKQHSPVCTLPNFKVDPLGVTFEQIVERCDDMMRHCQLQNCIHRITTSFEHPVTLAMLNNLVDHGILRSRQSQRKGTTVYFPCTFTDVGDELVALGAVESQRFRVPPRHAGHDAFQAVVSFGELVPYQVAFVETVCHPNAPAFIIGTGGPQAGKGMLANAIASRFNDGVIILASSDAAASNAALGLTNVNRLCQNITKKFDRAFSAWVPWLGPTDIQKIIYYCLNPANTSTTMLGMRAYSAAQMGLLVRELHTIVIDGAEGVHADSVLRLLTVLLQCGVRHIRTVALVNPFYDGLGRALRKAASMSAVSLEQAQVTLSIGELLTKCYGPMTHWIQSYQLPSIVVLSTESPSTQQCPADLTTQIRDVVSSRRIVQGLPMKTKSISASHLQRLLAAGAKQECSVSIIRYDSPTPMDFDNVWETLSAEPYHKNVPDVIFSKKKITNLESGLPGLCEGLRSLLEDDSRYFPNDSAKSSYQRPLSADADPIIVSEHTRWSTPKLDSSIIETDGKLQRTIAVVAATLRFNIQNRREKEQTRKIGQIDKHYWRLFCRGDIVRAKVDIAGGKPLSSAHPFCEFNTWPMRKGTIGVIEDIILFHPELGSKSIPNTQLLSRLPVDHSIRLLLDGRWVSCTENHFELLHVITPKEGIGRRFRSGILIVRAQTIYLPELCFWLEVCDSLTLLMPMGVNELMR